MRGSDRSQRGASHLNGRAATVTLSGAKGLSNHMEMLRCAQHDIPVDNASLWWHNSSVIGEIPKEMADVH